MSDERHGCPSASNFARLARCPGSWRLGQLAPPAERSEDAASGTRIHDALAGGGAVLNAEEQAILAQLRTLEHTVVSEWLGDASPDRMIREERFWRMDGDRERWSAKPDLVVVAGEAALVVEYKTGPVGVEDAAVNLQLRAQAAAVSLNVPGLRRVTVVVLQPRCSPPVTRCAYQERDLRKALAEMDRLVATAEWADAPVVAGQDQCRYCPAKPICPQAQAEITALVTSQSTPPALARMSELLDRCALAEHVIGSIRDHARRLLAEQANAIPGWQLAPGRSRETIENLQTVFERVHRLGVKPEQFVGACALTKKALKTLLEATTHERGALLEARLTTVIEGCVEVTQGQPMLVRRKEA
jgi:hypothetical protein